MVKSRIHFLLPIALAIVIPGLGIYANTRAGKPIIDSLGLLLGWVIASVLLYALWFAHQRTWKLHDLNKILWPLFVMLVFAILQAFGYYYFTDYSPGVIVQFAGARTILPSIIFLAIQYALDAQSNIGQLMLDKEQLQTENYRVRLQAIRAQIDPHFLFNSLNTLRSMVRQNHENAEQFILSLSDFYRHTLKHDTNTTLPLREELSVLESYFFLMKSRNEKSVNLDIHAEEQLHSFLLPALALQVVVENCFKHNSMTSNKPLHIQVSTTSDGWVMVQNNVQPRMETPEPSGLGLELIQKRYELLGENQGLIIDHNNTHFTAKLKLLQP